MDHRNPVKSVLQELRAHMPFTALGTLSGALLLGVLLWGQASRSLSETLFLFISVWLPCCTSDIVFPLLFARKEPEPVGQAAGVSHHL